MARGMNVGRSINRGLNTLAGAARPHGPRPRSSSANVYIHTSQRNLDKHRELLQQNVVIAEQWLKYTRTYEHIKNMNLPPAYRDQVTDFAPPAFSSPDARPLGAPVEWQALVPSAPNWLSRLFGGQGKYDKAVTEAKRAAVELKRKHQQAEIRRQEALNQQRFAHDVLCKEWQRRHIAMTQELLRLDGRMTSGDQKVIERYFEEILRSIDGPFEKLKVSNVRYVPESRRLLVEINVPSWKRLEGPKEHKFIKSRNEFKTVMRSEREVTTTYRDIVAGMVVGTLHAVFNGDWYDHVDSAIIHAEMAKSEVSPELVGGVVFASVGTSKRTFQSLDSPYSTVVVEGIVGKVSSRIRSLTSVAKLDDDSDLP